MGCNKLYDFKRKTKKLDSKVSKSKKPNPIILKVIK